ncbi:hypothetical protein ONE63_001691 [Megalurothrips usitatus]|uniref:BTB domain-containing protein n=1 Tax=Megalurothrips usitatus TaxID=439358 RepID=A0AAV7X937_9NEOP|nr:hypothetical protein ONE63_001691 [Megalurothrips usitatus]
MKTGFGADVEFLVGAEKVRAHSHLLAAASEVFAKTFEHDANYKATRSLKIEDANPLPFKEMIRQVIAQCTRFYIRPALCLKC